MNKNKLLEYMIEHFDYDKISGDFILKKKQYKGSKIGNKVGWIQPNGYRRISIKGKSYQAHRMIWLYLTGEMPKGDIDHINGIKSDNRQENLRDIPHSHNTQNRTKLSAANKTGYRGVSLINGKYVATVYAGKTITVGRFSDPELAELAYIEAKSILHEGCKIWQNDAAT